MQHKETTLKTPGLRIGCVTLILGMLVSMGVGAVAPQESPADLFSRGSQAYIAGGYEQAAASFREAVQLRPAPGTLHNLGSAEWQRGRPGPAILAWEQAQWLNPFSSNTRINLRYARKASQLDTPTLSWYEICSTWLPVNSWAWIATASFWTALALVVLPGPLRWRKSDWHQGVAAAGFAVFLLTLPALAGVHSRSKLGVCLEKETPLRLTPTQHAQVLTKLPAGELARFERQRGDYYYVRTGTAAGWVHRAQYGRITEVLKDAK